VLNRYWDELDTPRDESYLEDVQTAQRATGRIPSEVCRELRATAESGWDFSSRWFGDNMTLATVRTTSIIPVDLNSLLFHLETTIAHHCGETHDFRCVGEFVERAVKRAVGINRYLWNAKGYYGTTTGSSGSCGTTKPRRCCIRCSKVQHGLNARRRRPTKCNRRCCSREGS
jgi:alpha,alpha-trehalase